MAEERNLKVFNVVGIGYVIGQVLSVKKGITFLRYPAQVRVISDENNQLCFRCIDLVPEFLSNFDALIKNFPLKSEVVIMTGGLKPPLEKIYDVYLKELTKRLSGIDLLSPEEVEKFNRKV